MNDRISDASSSSEESDDNDGDECTVPRDGWESEPSHIPSYVKNDIDNYFLYHKSPVNAKKKLQETAFKSQTHRARASDV